MLVGNLKGSGEVDTFILISSNELCFVAAD